jgi:hypothetical protein
MLGFRSHATYLHLYLNGVYWGVYNTTSSSALMMIYQAEYFGGSDDDYFVTNHGGAEMADATCWNYLKGSLSDKDMSVTANYVEMQQYLNVKSFADYILLAFYICLMDWPMNN